MHKIYIKKGLPGSNPLTNALIVLAGAIVITLMLILGFFAFLAFSAVVLVTAAVLTIRSWWLGRNSSSSVAGAPPRSDEFIEGEFHVVKKDKNS